MGKGGQSKGSAGVRQTQWNKGPQSAADMMKKVDRTIGWYNRHGGLASQIDFKKVSTTLHAIHPSQALHVLKGMEGKEGTIKNPTAWIKKAAAGAVPELDPKVQKTITWYNKQGGLKQEIHYQTVKPILAALPVPVALKLLKGLEDKSQQINDPTAWIAKGATKQTARVNDYVMQADAWGGDSWGGEVSGKGYGKGYGKSGGKGWEKVKKTIGWYNNNGGLQQEIIFKEVAPFLEAVGVSAALQILKGLEDKGAGIKNPTAWIRAATMKQ